MEIKYLYTEKCIILIKEIKETKKYDLILAGELHVSSVLLTQCLDL